MPRKSDPLLPKNLLLGWLFAAVAGPLTLLLAALGQAFGAMLGGCTWIGLSLPLDRPVWALVNEPSIHFASLGAAGGYWLGSLVVTLFLALTATTLLPRPRTVAAELGVTHLGWGAAAIGVGWLPLLDLSDGHLAHWLDLHRLPAWWIWLPSLAAAAAAMLVALRLLALLQTARKVSGRPTRVLVVVLHLGFPALAWVVLAGLLRGQVPVPAFIGILLPFVAAVVIAVIGYPEAYVHRLEPVAAASFIRGLVALLVLWALILVAGRPLPGGRATGLLWGRPLASNNIRPWVRPVQVLGREPRLPGVVE